ncbi:B12-binding domain-containing radical SAM protein [Candidatus Woesearchaeota archaeon]|nr:B12-binding domain-containing radical SAM protein [Candidatus Woesearchaeota archaeon]
MKVTLIFAGISSCGFDSFGSGDYEASAVHLGLCYLSAYAKENGFKELDLIDMRKLKGWEDFKEEVRRRNPDVIGVSMNSPEFDIVNKVLKLVKEVDAKIITVLGGMHPSMEVQEVIDNKDVDYIIKGEGEISFTELLKSLEKGERPERIIEGVRPDLDALPFPDRELFDFKHIMMHPYFIDFKPPFVTIITGRGCMYNCSFCQPAERMVFGKVRRISVERVIQELKFLKQRYDFKSYMITDDCLIEHPDWVSDYCKRIKEEGLVMPFYCQGRADLIVRYEDKIKELAEIGLTYVSIGFESGNQRVLDFLRKQLKVEDNYNCVKVCKKYGIKILGHFMGGIPTETNEEFMDTVRLMKWIKKEYSEGARIGCGFYTPHPGSDLYEYCKEHDLSLVTHHGQFRRSGKGGREPKIKGIDYKFIEKALEQTLTPFQRVLLKLRKNNTFVKFERRMLQSHLVKKVVVKMEDFGLV